MIDWQLKTFNELSVADLYAVLALRQAVFVVEQNCPYQDADGEDQQALHLLGYEDEQLIAYARIFHATGKQKTSLHGADADVHRIGRVIVAPHARGRQLGRVLMEKAMQVALSNSVSQQIVIGAQCYLLDFYHSLDFICEGSEYLEDGIPHQDMRFIARAD